MCKKNLLISFLLLCLSVISTAVSADTNTLLKVDVNEDNILLLDVILGDSSVANSIDAYEVNGQLLIAIEPLFDSVKLRYQILGDQLIIWKDEEIFRYTFTQKNHPNLINITTAPQRKLKNKALNIWASDGFYQFIEAELLRDIFGVDVKVNLTRQLLTINSKSAYQKKKDLNDELYSFPIEKLALLSERRRVNRFYNKSSTEVKKNAITIADQYRLFTPPHGRVNLAANLNKQEFNGSVQLVSDLLYHSANLTMSKSDYSDFIASFNLARYKSSPDELVLGAFDGYRLGDISGVGNLLNTNSNTGVGAVFFRQPDGYRSNNQNITLDETAPPGWDAELYRNGEFLDRVIVPANGRLLFEDIEIFYGINNFEIRLYGPFGEEEVIYNSVDVKRNALSQGQSAYSINALDKNHRLINDQSDEDYAITNYGGKIDYGVTDQWQLGMSLTTVENDKQFLGVKNALSFQNMLFENDFYLDQNSNYSQLTSLTGSIFYNDNYSVRLESFGSFDSEDTNNTDFQVDHFTRGTLSYSLPTKVVLTRFAYNYSKTDAIENSSFSNLLSKNFGSASISHTLSYHQTKLKGTDAIAVDTDYFQGRLATSGRLYGFYVSSLINYRPDLEKPILKDSSISIKKTLKDPYNNNHYLSAQYYPLNKEGVEWRLRHSASWQSDDFNLTFSSGYDSTGDWNFQLGINFFLGYDHHNNHLIFDRNMSAGTATLDVHSYLDRESNGIPGPLDYNLPEVSYSGIDKWAELESGEGGRVILPGVYGNSEFAFSAQWQEGSAPVNKNYVVYTHPGAYVEVNMPFNLITDLTGFIVRQKSGDEVGLRNVEVNLLNASNEIMQTVSTDEDGYYEFLSLEPNLYIVRVAKTYLERSSYTSENIGFNITTSGRGGFVELPSLILRRMNNITDREAEKINIHLLNEDNVDSLVWSDDEEVNKNYFILPKKGDFAPTYSLTQPMPSEKTVEKSSSSAKKMTKNIELSTSPKVMGLSSSVLKVETSKTLLPTFKIKNHPRAAIPLSAKKAQKKESSAFKSNSWSIQFSAAAHINNQAAQSAYSSIGQLFVGYKVTNKGVKYHCVFSQGFASKAAATKALQTSRLKGMIIKNNIYTDVNEIN